MTVRLGRIQHHDPRNRGFAALERPLPKAHQPGQIWFTRDIYDQIGSNCTMCAAVGLARTGPFRSLFASAWPQYDSEQERFDEYVVSQSLDPWQGSEVDEPRYEGTSTDAPFRLMRDRGQIPGWNWLFGEDQLWEWVSLYGPAAFGISISEGMCHPDSRGYVHDEGPDIGGHAMAAAQAHQDRQAYRVLQSWGRGHGQNGRIWIPRPIMRRRLAEGGEAVTIQAAA